MPDETGIYSPGHDLYITAGNTTGCSVPGGNTIISSGLGYGGVAHNGGNVTLRTGDYYNKVWNFDYNGNLTFPANLSIGYVGNYIPVDGTIIRQADNEWLEIRSNGVEAVTTIGWTDDFGGGSGNVAEISFNNFPGQARIVTGQYGEQINTWQFRPDGTTTFPNNTIKAPDGSELRLYAESGNNYSVTSHTGPIWEAYVEDEGTGANVAWAWIQAHLSNGVNSPEVFIENKRGDDGAEIRWTFGSSGILSIPGAITLDADSESTQINISPNGEGAAFLQIPNTDTADIDNTRLANTLGNVTIETGAGRWTFDANGNLTVPGTIQSSTGTLVFQANIDHPDLAWTITNDNIGGANVSILYAPAGDDNHIGELIFPGSDGVGGLVYVGNVGTPYDNAMNLFGQGANTSVKISTVGGDWQWTFGNTGNLSTPYGSLTLDSGYETGTAGFIAPTGGVALVSTMLYNSGNIASQILQNREGFGEPVQISTYQDNDNPAKTWTFGTAGNLTLPGKLWAKASDSGSIAFTNNGVDERGYLKVDAGYNMIVNAESNFSVKRAGTDRIAITDTTSDVKAVTDVRFVANLAGSNKTWNFAASGIATLPSSSYIETTDANLKIGSQGTVTIRANAATGEGTRSWTFSTNGATTFPGNISVPGNLSTIAGFAFYNGDPISIVATATVWALSFANPYYIEIAKTGLPAGFDTLLGSGAWTATANGITLTVVSVVTNGDYWRITVAEDPSGTISTIATFNRAASGANIAIPSSGSITFANGVNILSTVGTYSNTNVASYLLQFDGDIEFTSSTAKIGNVDVVTVGDHIRSPSYQFSNGASILANVATKVTSSWTVTTGTNTYSFTVPESGTYLLWVIGNIPNGIIAWNATATITNSNVPVVGAQYAWAYDGGGTPIDFVSIPNQFIGTANTIVRNSTAPSATTNRFDFGINNTSGGAVTVTYGYTKL
jgi:hypothetical protein